VAGAIVAVGLLWVTLVWLNLSDILATSAQLAIVVAVAAACDVIRPDSGLIAAIISGLVVSNLPSFNIPARHPFVETLVQLIIGLLFVSIAATITPASLHGLILPTLGLVGVLVLIARPLAALISTRRTDLSKGECRFVGWMAPRGIVAAATATTFTAGLVSKHVGGAAKILPVTFLVIVATVSVYGMTASPVAGRLGVLRQLRSRPLLVGSQPWVIDLCRKLRQADVDALVWAGYERQRQQIRNANLPLAERDLMPWISGQTADLEGITDVYLLTDEHDYNALASIVLHASGEGEGPKVYRVAPPTDERQVTPRTADEMLFGNGLDASAIAGKYRRGARIDSRQSGDGTTGAPGGLLFVIDREGLLHPSTEATTPTSKDGDIVLLLAEG
jgi:hypothetical protein